MKVRGGGGGGGHACTDRGAKINVISLASISHYVGAVTHVENQSAEFIMLINPKERMVTMWC